MNQDEKRDSHTVCITQMNETHIIDFQCGNHEPHRILFNKKIRQKLIEILENYDHDKHYEFAKELDNIFSSINEPITKQALFYSLKEDFLTALSFMGRRRRKKAAKFFKMTTEKLEKLFLK